MAAIHFYDANEQDTAQLGELADKYLKGHKVVFQPESLSTPPANADVVSTFISSKIPGNILDVMPQLKLVACRSTGYDNVDVATASRRGVTVCNVPTYGENTVAEYAFGLLLSLVRKIPTAIEQLREGDTSHTALQGIDLKGKTLGLLGAGRIGCHMAAIADGFGMKVIAYDTHIDPTLASKFNFTYSELDKVLGSADIISVHLPSLPSTHHLLNAEKLTKMKPSAVLINTARGEVVDTKALIDALTNGKIAGAAVDVFEGEAVASIDAELNAVRARQVDRLVLEQDMELNLLRKLPNVIITNHNAYNTVEAVQRINETTVQNIAAFLDGKPQNQVSAL